MIVAAASTRPWRSLALICTIIGGGCLRPGVDGHPERPGRAPPTNESDFRCARATMGRDSPYRMPLAGPETDPRLAVHLDVLPPEARRTALAAGLEPLLARLLDERASAAGPQPSPQQLSMQDALLARVVAFHAQVSAAAFEAGCTADMIQKVLSERAHHEQSRQVTIAIGSLVAGAVAGVAAGVWGLSDGSSRGPALLSVAGGVASTALGAVALTHEDPPLWFQHARNRLTPVWVGLDPEHHYPSFVFRMLTFASADGGRSPRDELLETWRRRLDDELTDAAERAAAERHLLGEGGVYDDQLLTLRAEMFEGIESAVNGMTRDLELLNRSLVRVLATPQSSGEDLGRGGGRRSGGGGRHARLDLAGLGVGLHAHLRDVEAGDLVRGAHAQAHEALDAEPRQQRRHE